MKEAATTPARIQFTVNWQYASLPTIIMISINKLILVGHLATDPETSPSRSGRNRVSFALATHREQTSEGVRKDVTDYHRIIVWGKLGEDCLNLTKGTAVYVEGTLITRSYERNGERRYTTLIAATEVNRLSWKNRNGVATVSLESPEPAPKEAA